MRIDEYIHLLPGQTVFCDLAGLGGFIRESDVVAEARVVSVENNNRGRLPRTVQHLTIMVETLNFATNVSIPMYGGLTRWWLTRDAAVKAGVRRLRRQLQALERKQADLDYQRQHLHAELARRGVTSAAAAAPLAATTKQRRLTLGATQ